MSAGEDALLEARLAEIARPLQDATGQVADTLIGFRSGRAALAVLMSEVHSVRQAAAPTSLPEVPRSMLGIVALEGLVVPVIAPEVLLGFAESAAGADPVNLIVLDEGGTPMVGLLYDTLDGPMPTPATLQPLPGAVPPLLARLVRGLAEEHLVLDASALVEAFLPEHANPNRREGRSSQ